MNVKFVDGLVEQLKGQTPLPEQDGNPIYKLMQEKDLGNTKLAKIVRDLHEHRPVTEDRYGQEKQAPEKDIRIMTDATPNIVTFAVTGRKPDADGTFGILARVSMTRGQDGRLSLDDFHTSLDPTGYENNSHQYVNLADGISKAYKGATDQFVANFLQGLSKGDDVWGALSHADYSGKIDNIFDGARKEEQSRLDAGEKPISLRKIVDGRIPGTFEGYAPDNKTSVETRSSYAPTLRHKN